MIKLINSRSITTKLRNVVVLNIILSLIFYFYFHSYSDPLHLVPDHQVKDARRILWLVAHPDDESLFFSPSITNLLDNDRAQGHILSISTGDAEGLGSIRINEMKNSCSKFGVSNDHCVILSYSELPDSMDVWWDENDIRRVVLPFISKWDIDLIITFDEHGISNHANHRAIYTAFSSLPQSNDLHLPPIYKLHTTNKLYKFSHLLSLPISLAFKSPSTSILLSSFTNYHLGLDAFNQHASQARWYRTAQTLIGRYLWLNELERIH